MEELNMKRTRKLFCLFIAVLMMFTLSVTAFAANETNDGNIKIEVSTNKGSYGVTDVAEITATITNISDEDINNVIAQAVFNDLAPVAKRKSQTSESVDVLKSGESFSFKYKVTLNEDKHKINFFEKIILWLVRLFNGGYSAGKQNFDVVAENITEIKFGKFAADNVIQVGYDKNTKEVTDEDFRVFQDIRESIDDIFDIEDVVDVLEADKEKGSVIDYEVNENYITYETACGIQGIWEGEALYTDDNKSVSLDGKTHRVYETPSGNNYEDIINQAASLSIDSDLGDIAVIRPYRENVFTYDDFVTTSEIIADTIGVNTVVFDNENATLSVLKDLDKYGIVLIDSHGTLIDDEPYLCLTQTYDSKEILSSDLEYVYINQDNEIRVNSGFFENNYADNEFNDCLIFLGTCYSMYDESFSDTLIKKGVDCVYGYTDIVSVAYCNDTLVETMLENLLIDGDNSFTAFNKTASVCEETDPNNPDTYFKKKLSGNFSLAKTVNEGKVEGVVTDANSKNPISGVKVSVIDNNDNKISETHTDENGKYTLNLSYGEYAICFDYYNYEQSEIQITVNAESHTQNAELTPKYADKIIVTSGNCGDGIAWTLFDDGELIIGGNGAIADYGSYTLLDGHNSDIKKVVIENGITKIGDKAFYDCVNLEKVEISDSVTDIGEMAFCFCTELDGVVIPDSVSGIGESAFASCTNLKNLTIANGVRNIGDFAFYGCISLDGVIIPDSVITIGEGAFYSCWSLKSIAIPNGISSIKKEIFKDCSGLTSVTIPDSVISIEKAAFDNCNKLTDVYYNGTTTQWQEVNIDANGNDCLTGANIHCKD